MCSLKLNIRFHLQTMGIACFLYFIVPATNIFVLAACSALLSSARELQQLDIPTIHREHWVDNLITWSIVSMCVAIFQTIFLFSFFWLVAKFPDPSTKLRNARILFCAVQLVLIPLILTSVIIPGIDQWPESYKETDWAMYSAISFIVIYLTLLFFVAKALLSKQSPHLTNAT